MKGEIKTLNPTLIKRTYKTLPSGKQMEVMRRDCTLTHLYRRTTKYG